MNGIMFGKPYNQITNKELESIDTIALPFQNTVHSIGVFLAPCPFCQTKQRCLLDRGGKEMIFVCEECNNLTGGINREKVKVMSHAH